MTCYISGAISSDPFYKQKFDEAEKMLKRMGYEVFNPTSNFHKEWKYEQYLRFDLEKLLKCDYIYLLPGWEKSNGAKLEKLVADNCGIKTLEIKELSRKWE